MENSSQKHFKNNETTLTENNNITPSQPNPKRRLSTSGSLKNNTNLSKKLKHSPQTFNFSFIPDPSLYQGGTWREEEMLGHNSLAYPCAELIDNSLMATRKSNSRIIDVHIIHRKANDVFFVVCDNGEGMDFEGLQNLAVFAHAPQHRGDKAFVLDTKNSKAYKYVNSCISRFGVGLKNAAFHMGKNVTIMTKREDSSCVLEFNMNITAMLSTYKKNRQQAYEGQVTTREPGDYKSSVLDLMKPCDSIQKIIRKELETPHFTTIVISQLCDEHIANLSELENRNILARNLASLYHYYLNSIFGKSASGKQRAKSKKLVTPAKIYLKYANEIKRKSETIDLADVSDDIQTLNHKLYAGTPFKFEISLPNKDPVVGVIYYFPFLNDSETIPPFTHQNYSNSDLNSSTSQSFESEESKTRNFRKESNAIFEPIFNCFWQGRQIPFTNVTILNFMLSIHPTLRRRIRGALFLNESFPVNPQKNIFNVDLNETLNSKLAEIQNIKDDLIDTKVNKNTAKRIKTRTKTQCENNLRIPKKRFLEWVNRMSEKYDKEIEYKEKTTQSTKTHSYYTKVVYGKKVFKSGDLAKVNCNDKSAHFGNIVKFCVKEGTDGTVKYTRLPEIIYGKELFSRLTRELDKKLSAKEVQEEFTAEESKLLADFPHSLSFNFKTDEFEHLNKPPQKVVSCGYSFPDVYLKILGKPNGKEKPKSLSRINALSPKKNSILVVKQILQHFSIKTDQWETDRLINGETVYECPPLVNKYWEKGTYYFKPIMLTLPGVSRVVFAVTTKMKPSQTAAKPPSEWLVEHKFKVQVKIGAPKILKMPDIQLKATLGSTNEYSDLLIPLEIKDMGKNPIPYDPKFSFEAKFSYPIDEVKEESDFKVTAEVEYSKTKGRYYLCNFLAMPSKNKTIDISGSQTRLRVDIKVNRFKSLSGILNFHVFPGVPSAIKMSSPPQLLAVENNSVISNVFFHLEDEFGNFTTSRFGVDNLVFSVDKVEGVCSEAKVNLDRIERRKFCLSSFKLDIQFKKQTPVNITEVPFKIYAIKNKRKTNISKFLGCFKVKPSTKVSQFVMCRSTSDKDYEAAINSSTLEFNVGVGKINQIYVIFADETGKRDKDIKLKDVGNIKLKLFDKDIRKLTQDKNGDIMFEVAVPGKMKGTRHCHLECALKNSPGLKMEKHFKLVPIFDDPVKWDLDFVDSIPSGSKIGDFLMVWLTDQYGNRLNANDFEDPLLTAPRLKPSCELLNMTPSVSAETGCYFFSEGEIRGRKGKHSLEIEENEEYDFGASNQFSFFLESGEPSKLELKAYRKESYSAVGDVWAFTHDMLCVEAQLTDASGNTVVSGANRVEISLYKNGEKKTISSYALKRGALEANVPLKLGSEFIGQVVVLEISTRYKREGIKTSKEMKIKATPNFIKFIELPTEIKDKTIVISIEQLPPEIRCKAVLESGGNYVGETKRFQLEIGEKEVGTYSKAVLEGNALLFPPKRRITLPGNYICHVVYHEVRPMLPSVVKSQQFRIQVIPGSPKFLCIKNRKDFDSLSASNMGKSRLVAKKISVGVCDCDTNEIDLNTLVGFNPSLKVDVVAKGKVAPADMPKISYKLNKMEIYDVLIKEKSGNCEGKFFLKIVVDPSWKAQNANLQNVKLSPVSLEFYFSNDTKSVTLQKQLETQASKIQSSIEETLSKLKPFKQVEQTLSALCSEFTSLKSKCTSFASLPSLSDAKKALALRESALSHSIGISRRNASLPAFKDPLQRLPGYIGRVGELADAENAGQARCLSYLLGSRLNIHLTRGSASRASKRCLEILKSKKNISYLDVDLLPRHNFDTKLKGGRLPHEGRFPFAATAAPVYAVHKLRMRPGAALSRTEFERVFAHFLSNGMVMERLEDAIDYEKKCVDRKVYCSTIVTTDGYHVQLVKHAIPTYDLLHRKQRCIAVYPEELVLEQQSLVESQRPALEKFFVLKRKIDALRVTSGVAEKAALERKLASLQKDRLRVLGEIRDSRGNRGRRA